MTDVAMSMTIMVHRPRWRLPKERPGTQSGYLVYTQEPCNDPPPVEY
jgi:hypothetical protein